MSLTQDAINQIQNELVPTSGVFTYGNGYAQLTMTGNCNVISITHSSNISAESNLMPNNTLVRYTSKKIIICKATLQPFPVDLFNYIGDLKIKRVVLYGPKTKLTASIVHSSSTELWNKDKGDDTWSSDEEEWVSTAKDNYTKKTDTQISTGEGFTIYNLSNINGQYKNQDGTTYIGKYRTTGLGEVLKGTGGKDYLYKMTAKNKLIPVDKNYIKNIKKDLKNIFRNEKAKQMQKENLKNIMAKKINTGGGYNG